MTSEQYGPEWEQEMMRCTKADLIHMLRLDAIHGDRVVEQLCALERLATAAAMFVYTAKKGKIQPPLDMLEKALHDAGQEWRIKQAEFVTAPV